MSITKIEAAARARKVLAGGHFRRSASEAYVYYVASDGVRHTLDIYGCMGRLPKHADMVAQVAQGIRDAEAGDR